MVEIRFPKYGSERVVLSAEDLVNMLAAMSRAVSGPKDGSSSEPMMATHQNTVGYWWAQTLRDAGCKTSSCTTCATSTRAVDRLRL